MPDKTTQRELDKFEALLEMIAENGATPAGQLPPVEHIDALREMDDLDRGRIQEVAEAHRNGNAPPVNQ